MDNKLHAFTLVELLVVLAVVLILAALLLPVLSNSRAKGLRLQCLNNIRQVNLLLLTYGHDNNDRLPSTGHMLVLPPPLADTAVKGGIPHRIFFDPARVEAARAKILGFSDPSTNWFVGSHYPGRIIGYYLTLPGSIGLQPTNVNPGILPQPFAMGKVMFPPPNASERVLVAGGTWANKPGFPVSQDAAHLDSKGSCLGDNVAMLDGSAKWRKFKAMLPRTLYESASEGYALWW